MKRIDKLLESVSKSRKIIQKLLDLVTDEDTIYDLKGMDNHLKLLEKLLIEFKEELKNAKNTQDILRDPGYTTRMAAWTDGLVIRVEDYSKRVKRFREDIAHKYWDATLEYIDTIIKYIQRWKKGISLIEDFPDIPH